MKLCFSVIAVKLDPPPKPFIDNTTFSWSPQLIKRRFRDYHCELQWKEADKSWSVRRYSVSMLSSINECVSVCVYVCVCVCVLKKDRKTVYPGTWMCRQHFKLQKTHEETYIHNKISSLSPVWGLTFVTVDICLHVLRGWCFCPQCWRDCERDCYISCANDLCCVAAGKIQGKEMNISQLNMPTFVSSSSGSLCEDNTTVM